MAKTLNQFLEGYLKVKNPDEQKFVDKHVVAKHADRNGNGDEVFKGSKVKMDDRRKSRHGYNPGEDEKVYEELKGNQHKLDHNKNGKIDAHDFKLLRSKKKVAEEAEELEELSTDTLRSYRAKAKDDAEKISFDDEGADRRMRKRSMGSWDAGKKILKRGDALRKEEAEELEELSKKTLDSYTSKASGDLGFTHGIAKNHRYAQDQGGAGRKPEHKAMDNNRLRKRASGLVNSLKRLAKEESEQIDELSKKTLGSYVVKSLVPSSEKSVSNLASKGGYKLGQAHDDDYTAGEKEDAKSVKRSLGVLTAVRKMTKEDAEIEEKLNMDKASMGDVITDFKDSNAPQFKGKSQDKRRTMAIAAKLTAERGGKPLRKEEKLADLLGDLIESHRRTMLSVFDKLNESNQKKFLEACETPEGVDSMLDFSISHRGE